jgi:hypothetical protein
MERDRDTDNTTHLGADSLKSPTRQLRRMHSKIERETEREAHTDTQNRHPPWGKLLEETDTPVVVAHDAQRDRETERETDRERQRERETERRRHTQTHRHTHPHTHTHLGANSLKRPTRQLWWRMIAMIPLSDETELVRNERERDRGSSPRKAIGTRTEKGKKERKERKRERE